MGLLGFISDAVDSASSFVSDTYEGVSDAASGVVDTVAEVGSDAYDTVSDAAGGAVDYVADTGSAAYEGISEGVGDAADWVGEKADSVAELGGGAIDAAGDALGSIDPMAAAHYAVKGVKGIGSAATAMGGKFAPYMGKLAGLGKAVGPLGMLDGGIGMVRDIMGAQDPEEGQSGKDFDASSFIGNALGFGGGLGTTLGSLGIGGGSALAGGSAAAGGAAAAGGSVLGAGAAGFAAGTGLAKLADSKYGQDEHGKTSYDYNTEAAVRTEKWANEALGLDDDHWAGKIAGGGHAALGGIGAGLVGGGQAIGNFVSENLPGW
jgi:hypothetical protein